MKDLIIRDVVTDLTEEKTSLILSSFAPVVKTLTDFGKDLPTIEALEMGSEKCKKAKRFRIDFGKELTKADNIRKALKEESLKEGKAIQSVYNYIKTATEDTKNTALDIERHYEKIEEEKRRLLRIQRIGLLLRYEIDGLNMDLGNMADEIWFPYYAGIETAYKAKKEAERLEEEQRVADIEVERRYQLRRDELAPYARFGAFIILKPEMTENEFISLSNTMKESAKKEADQQARIKTENERLRIEATEKEAILQAEREETQRVQREADAAEQRRITDANKVEQEKRDRIGKYSKLLLEAGYETYENGVYTLGMNRVTDTQLESLSEKEFQDRLVEAADNHQRVLQLEQEKAAREKLQRDIVEKETQRVRTEQEREEREAEILHKARNAPDKEKLQDLITHMGSICDTLQFPVSQRVVVHAKDSINSFILSL